MDYVVETHGINLDRPGIEVLEDVIERTWLRYKHLSDAEILDIASTVLDVLAMNLYIEFDEVVFPLLSLQHKRDRESFLPTNTPVFVEGERPVDFKLNGKRR
jgi:hypothetical protein